MTTTIMERRATGWDTTRFDGMQWKPVVAGALAGFAATIILTTLGAAIGVTAGADSGGDAQKIGAGASIWWLLTVIVAGIVAGRVIASTARVDSNYHPVIYGTVAWVLGVLILLSLLAWGAASVIGGLGAGFGVTAAARGGGMVHAGGGAGTAADTAQAMQTAANVGKAAMWGLLVSQILGLAATVLGARVRSGESRRTATSGQPATAH